MSEIMKKIEEKKSQIIQQGKKQRGDSSYKIKAGAK